MDRLIADRLSALIDEHRGQAVPEDPDDEDDEAGCCRSDESSGARRSTSRRDNNSSSCGRLDLSWAGSTQLGPDLAGGVREIRDRHEHVKVVGSLNLVQTLLREKLFDRLDLWVHPVVLGVGKKVFDDGAVPTNVTLLEPPLASPQGIVYLRYGLADGTPRTGDMSAPDRGLEHDA